MRSILSSAPRIKIVILLFSVAIFIFGYLIEDRALLQELTEDGKCFSPQSSGSEDRAMLSLALMSFIITIAASIISILFNQHVKTLLIVYGVNFFIFLFFVLLVIMDSSLISAAKCGDYIPLLGVLFVCISSFSLFFLPIED